MNNTPTYESYETFIDYLKGLANNSLRLKAIHEYFLEQVEYNYTTLNIAKVDICKLMRLDDTYDSSNPSDRDQAIIHLRHTLNIPSDVIEKLLETYGKKVVVPATPKTTMFGKEIPAKPKSHYYTNLVQAYNNIKLDREYRNGLLVSGVCADISTFYAKVCKDIGVDCDIVDGMTDSRVSHVWNKIADKNYDLTYAIFVRDKYRDLHKTFKASDWIGCSDNILHSMHPERVVTSTTPYKE